MNTIPLRKIKVLLRRNIVSNKGGVTIPALAERYAEATMDLSRFYINVEEGEQDNLRIVTDDVKSVDILEFF